MKRRLGKLALFAVAIIAVAGLGLAWWNLSDPESCLAEADPAVALANERAGGQDVYTERCHAFDGHSLHVVEAGEGEVVLFIHGFPTIWYSMIRPMEHLRQDYRVVAIDGLGAGRSDAPTEVEPYKLAEMAKHLDAVIDDLGVDKVHLVGHDWGAAFVGGYAQSRPGRVQSVTIMSAPPQNIAVRLLETSGRQRKISEYVERLKSASPWLALLSGTGEAMASGPANHLKAGRISAKEAQVLTQGTSDLRRINRHINWYRANLPAPDAIADEDFWPSRDAKLEVPALLIWGKDDTIFDPGFIMMMEQDSAQLEVLELEGVGHAPQWEATEAVNEAIARHIRTASPD